MADLVWSDPDPEKEDFAISPRSVYPFLLRLEASLQLKTTQGGWIHLWFRSSIQIP
jgi:hypothetical protein